MALPAGHILMIAFERPADAGVVERPGHRCLLSPMAFFALVGFSPCQVHVLPMAAHTGTMMLDEGRRGGAAVETMMASCTARLMMALHTIQAELLDVLGMPEDDATLGTACTRKEIAFGKGNRRMHLLELLVRGGKTRTDRVTLSIRQGHVADFASGFINPIAVAIEALLMIGTLESGHARVGSLYGRVMAGTTGRRPVSRGRMMMAVPASSRHFRHSGVPLVIKANRHVLAHQIVQKDNVRCGVDGQRAAKIPRARVAQAAVGGCGVFAKMAAVAVPAGTATLGDFGRRGRYRFLRHSRAIRANCQPKEEEAGDQVQLAGRQTGCVLREAMRFPSGEV